MSVITPLFTPSLLESTVPCKKAHSLLGRTAQKCCRVAGRSRSTHQLMPSSIYFGHNGKCAANFFTGELDMNAPKDLMNLDVMHKRSTGRNVEAMNHGRFNTAPRGTLHVPNARQPRATVDRTCEAHLELTRS